MSKFIDGLASLDLATAIRAVALEVVASADDYAAECGPSGDREIAVAAAALAESGDEGRALRNPGSDEVAHLVAAAVAIDEAQSAVENENDKSAAYSLRFAWRALVRFERGRLHAEEIEARIRHRLRVAVAAA